MKVQEDDVKVSVHWLGLRFSVVFVVISLPVENKG